MSDADCGCQDGAISNGATTEAINPFTGLKPHFGMLLGVEDLQVAQGYPIGKLRLHNAWQHGAGVVWGLDVRFDEPGPSSILRVEPGLALDAAGHEVFLERAVCLDLVAWFEQHHDDAAFTFTDMPDGAKRFSCAVVACFRACPDRPVPSIVTPCEGTGAESAYSRIEETAELLLKPIAETARLLPYPRVRVLFGLEDDRVELGVGPFRDAIQALDPALQPRATLDAFRVLAARDELELRPQDRDGRRSLFPEEPSCVLLAQLIDVELERSESGGLVLRPPPTPTTDVRRALLPTTTIQELLCGAIPAPAPGGPLPPAPPDAGGPRLDPASVTVEGQRITFTTSSALERASLGAAAISVTAFGVNGWRDVAFRAELDPTGTSISLALEQAIDGGELVRLIVRGTGPQPVLGTNRIPLAGLNGGPPASPDEGCDAVLVKERS